MSLISFRNLTAPLRSRFQIGALVILALLVAAVDSERRSERLKTAPRRLQQISLSIWRRTERRSSTFSTPQRNTLNGMDPSQRIANCRDSLTDRMSGQCGASRQLSNTMKSLRIFGSRWVLNRPY